MSQAKISIWKSMDKKGLKAPDVNFDKKFSKAMNIFCENHLTKLNEVNDKQWLTPEIILAYFEEIDETMTEEEKDKIKHREVIHFLEKKYTDDFNAEKQQLKNYTLKKVL